MNTIFSEAQLTVNRLWVGLSVRGACHSEHAYNLEINGVLSRSRTEDT